MDASGVRELSLDEARNRLPELVNLVEADDEFVYLTRGGRRVAVLMPADIGENYERIEDDYFARKVRDREDGRDDARPLEDIIAELEVDDR